MTARLLLCIVSLLLLKGISFAQITDLEKVSTTTTFTQIDFVRDLSLLELFITDGTIASFDPSIPEFGIETALTGPYIGTANKAGRINNLCSGTSAILSAYSDQTTFLAEVSSAAGLSSPLTSVANLRFQWYKSVATKPSTKDLTIDDTKTIQDISYTEFSRMTKIIPIPEYIWSDWEPISKATSKNYTVNYSSEFTNSNILHVAYICVVSYNPLTTRTTDLTKTTTLETKETTQFDPIITKPIITIPTVATGITAFSRADEPVYGEFIIESAYACKGDSAIVQLDFEVTGDQTKIFWEKRTCGTNCGEGTWAKESDAFTVFKFPAESYNLDQYDYRLAVEHSCGDFRSPSLHESNVEIFIGGEEYFENLSPEELVKTVCIDSKVSFFPQLKKQIPDVDYTISWQVKLTGKTTWETISSSESGVYSNFDDFMLSITPDDYKYHNAQYRCVATGPCASAGSDISETFTLKLNKVPEVPTITITPTKVCPGSEVTLEATVSDTELANPIEYRWEINDNLQEVNFSSSASKLDYIVGSQDLKVTCQVQNGNMCAGKFSHKTIVVPVYKKPDVSLNVTRTGCDGSTADLSAVVTGGKPVYSYMWSVPQDTKYPNSSRIGLAPNERYYVTVTDQCSNTDTVSVFVEEPQKVSLNVNHKNVLCNEQENGSITAEIAGGTLPYQLTIVDIIANDTLFNHKDSSLNIVLQENLKSGRYEVKVKDGCDSIKSAEIHITQPDKLQATIADYKNISCFNGGDGYAEVKATGGSEPYNISWMNGQQGTIVQGLFKGTQTVHVVDNNGCLASAQVNLTQPLPLAVSHTIENVTCNGASNGAIDIIAENGTQPYTFTINNDKGEAVANESYFDQFVAGTYIISVIDACNDIYEKAVEINQPDALSYQIVSEPVFCFGNADGKAQVVINGGVEPYVIDWETGINGTLVTSLDTGFTTVEISDQCTTHLDSVEITQPETLEVSVAGQDVECYGQATGVATSYVTGGTMPYTYAWSNGMRTQTAENLFAGDYTVQVVDANGCSAYNSVTIIQSPVFNASAEINHIDCAGESTGSITINSTLESDNVTYTWNNSDWDGAQTVEQLPAGDYEVTVADACGSEVVLQPEVFELHKPLKVSITANDIACFGAQDGSIEIIAEDGKLPYAYSWFDIPAGGNFEENLNAGDYMFTVTDACGEKTFTAEIREPAEFSLEVTKTDIACFGMATGQAEAIVTGGSAPYIYSWNNGVKTSLADNLFAGVYTVQAVDANGCIAFNSAEIIQNERFNAGASITHVECAGKETGVIEINTNLSGADAQYDWNNDDWDGLAIVENIGIGEYAVTVSDNCNNSVTLTPTVLAKNNKLEVNGIKADVTCFGMNDGFAEIDIKYGVEPYTVLWSSGESEMKVENLGQNELSVTVTDACGESIKTDFMIEEPELFDITVDITDADCFGSGTGGGQVIVSGGVEPYVYNWNVGLQVEALQGLFAGDYSVNVFDANGCLASESFTVAEPMPLTSTLTARGTKCGESDGTIEAHVVGGTAPYSYLWSTGEATETIENIGKGHYSVTITDTNGCSISSSISVGVYIETPEICMLTVDDDNGKNKVVWDGESQNEGVTNKIYRMVGGVYQYMGSVQKGELSFYDDMLSQPKVVAARYVLTNVDACGNESDFSPFHQTIHLGAAKGIDEESVVLDWTPYIDEAENFVPQWYYLYRGSGTNDFVLFDSVDATVATSYNDPEPNGALYYYVSVKKEGGCKATELKTNTGPYSHSISNIAEIDVEVVGINDSNITAKILPNPSNGKFELTVNGYENTYAEIISIAGIQVWSQELHSQQTIVDISSQATGIYTLILHKDGTEYAQKIIIKK